MRQEDTAVFVVFFEDMKGSTVLKERMAEKWDEEAFQNLRREHDALIADIITRDHGGEIIKSRGDGFLAVFTKPSTAVERAVEIQEKLHSHPHLSVRIGMDMGEVRVESDGQHTRDVFGRHVDWAARAMELADGGHICVTRAVYTDAFSWITKARIAWRECGLYRLKPGDPPLEIFQPYNANIAKPMDSLRGEYVGTVTSQAQPPSDQAPSAGQRGDASARPPGGDGQQLRIVRSWESVARDGRDFAENGAGMMYWFKVPLGGLAYPEGFRNFLQPALVNPKISKIRFVLESSVPTIRQIWFDLVLPLCQNWAKQEGRDFRLDHDDDGGQLVEDTTPSKTLAWVFVDLSLEFTPCFKLLIPDPDTNEETESEAQIFLSTASRSVKLRDGTLQTVRIPDAILRVSAHENDSLFHALNSVANQWDSLFS